VSAVDGDRASGHSRGISRAAAASIAVSRFSAPAMSRRYPDRLSSPVQEDRCKSCPRDLMLLENHTSHRAKTGLGAMQPRSDLLEQVVHWSCPGMGLVKVCPRLLQVPPQHLRTAVPQKALEAVHVRPASEGENGKPPPEGMQSGRSHSSSAGSTPEDVPQTAVAQSPSVLRRPHRIVCLRSPTIAEVAYHSALASRTQERSPWLTAFAAAYWDGARAKVDIPHTESNHLASRGSNIQQGQDSGPVSTPKFSPAITSTHNRPGIIKSDRIQQLLGNPWGPHASGGVVEELPFPLRPVQECSHSAEEGVLPTRCVALLLERHMKQQR
jgi:hypothetical protein